LYSRFCRSAPPPGWPHTDSGRFQIGAGGLAAHTVACSIRRKDQPSRPKAIIFCRLSSLNTLLMPLEATLPPSDVNVLGDYFSLAGCEVTTYGRFWVTPEDSIAVLRSSIC